MAGNKTKWMVIANTKNMCTLPQLRAAASEKTSLWLGNVNLVRNFVSFARFLCVKTKGVGIKFYMFFNFLPFSHLYIIPKKFNLALFLCIGIPICKLRHTHTHTHLKGETRHGHDHTGMWMELNEKKEREKKNKRDVTTPRDEMLSSKCFEEFLCAH